MPKRQGCGAKGASRTTHRPSPITVLVPMSSLNKSFIKAYRKSAVEVEPAKTPARPHFVPPAALGKGPAKVSAERADVALPSVSLEAAVCSAAALPPRELRKPQVTPIATPELPEQQAVVVDLDAVVAEEKPLTIVKPVERTVVDTAHQGVRAPHANFVDVPRVAPSTKIATTSSPIAPTQPTAPISEAAVSPRPVILPITGPSPIWRPVYEVANFTWPELTDVLLDAASAQFRTAASDLAEACRRHRKLVSITAARRGEGCTIIALALAKALAEQQQRVILVDAHFEAPGLADNLGLAAQVGLEDTLTGEKPLVEALVESLEDRVVVLPLRQPAASDWRLSIARLKSSLDELLPALRRRADRCWARRRHQRSPSVAVVGRPMPGRSRLWWCATCVRPATTKPRKLNGVCTVAVSHSGISWKTSPLRPQILSLTPAT